MFFNKWMIRQTVSHTYHGIQVGNKEEQNIDTHNLDEISENAE